jgi:hypothetical protein
MSYEDEWCSCFDENPKEFGFVQSDQGWSCSANTDVHGWTLAQRSEGQPTGQSCDETWLDWTNTVGPHDIRQRLVRVLF